MTPTINNPTTLGSVVTDVAAIRVVTDALPDAGALTSVKPRGTTEGGIVVIPALDAARPLSSATPDTFGAYVQITANYGEEVEIIGVLWHGADLDILDGVVEIATGDAASEVELVTLPMAKTTVAAARIGIYYPFDYPPKVPNGVRIACRVADNAANNPEHSVNLVIRETAHDVAYDA